jgi:hypothetical protein
MRYSAAADAVDDNQDNVTHLFRGGDLRLRFFGELSEFTNLLRGGEVYGE